MFCCVMKRVIFVRGLEVGLENFLERTEENVFLGTNSLIFTLK